MPTELSQNQVKIRLKAAIQKFLRKDLHLLKVRCSERSVCHKLAEHLNSAFRNWDIDCEYNRNGDIPKKIMFLRRSEEQSVYPDIIIHKRGLKKNLLVIEAKRIDTSEVLREYDKQKLEAYLSEHNYRYAVSLEFGVNSPWQIDVEFSCNEKLMPTTAKSNFSVCDLPNLQHDF